MSLNVINIREGKDAREAVARAVSCLTDGGLVAFPTETVYGIGALATDERAIARLRDVKSRPDGPFSVHIPSGVEAFKYVDDIPLCARWMMERGWPGPLTLLLDISCRFADEGLNRVPGLFDTLTSDGVIGLRCPDEPFACRMLTEVGGPVVAPSANVAGAPSPRSADEVANDLGEKLDLLIDAGATQYGRDSTIVRVESDSWKVIREGVYDERMIRRMVSRRICFVCTGNTCRSPMAAGLARKLIAERLRCDPEQLSERGVEVISAGLGASGGSRAISEAVSAMAEYDVDISGHTTKKCTPDLIKNCDLVLCMTDIHRERVSLMAGGATTQVRRLDEKGDIPDPIGGKREVYLSVARRIRAALGNWLDIIGR